MNDYFWNRFVQHFIYIHFTIFVFETSAHIFHMHGSLFMFFSYCNLVSSRASRLPSTTLFIFVSYTVTCPIKSLLFAIILLICTFEEIKLTNLRTNLYC